METTVFDSTKTSADNLTLQKRFFDASAADPEVQKIADDIKKQDSVFHFLRAFSEKNGIPRWEKTLYKLHQKRVDNGSPNNDSNRDGSAEGVQGVFFIPLQSLSSSEIKSYITAYKHNDSSYTYRLYNRDSLNVLTPGSNQTKTNLLHTQAMFGYFEKQINNQDAIEINAPFNGRIRNVQVGFEEGNSQGGRSLPVNQPGMNSSMSCFAEITVTVTYEWRDFTYSYNDSGWYVVSVQINILLFCLDDMSGSGSGSGGSGGGSNNYWWQWGTGWPYGGSGGSGYYDPNWYWWWTSGGGGLTPLQSFYNSLTLPQMFFWDNPGNYSFVSVLTDRLTQSNFSLQEQEFAKWAIDYLLSNPTVSFATFYNQFLMRSEGADEVDDQTFWDDPNNTFPAQTLPSFTDFEAAFPKRSDPLYDTSPELYTTIGGDVLARVGTGADVNTCAARVSRALNYSGITIPDIPNKTFRGADGKYYFLGAENLNRWMRKTFGCANPNTAIGEYLNANSLHYNSSQIGMNGANLPSLLSGVQGIYSMVSNNYNWATGHADLMTSTPTCDGGCHFDGPVRYIDVWKLQ